MIPIPMIMGLATPFIKQLAGTLMEGGLNLAANAVTGGGKKAKEYIEKKTGISLDSPDKLSGDDLDEIAKLEENPEAVIRLKELSLEFLKEKDRHEEATDQNWEDRMRIHADVDKAGASTRPKIALMMAKIVAFTVIGLTSALFVSIFKGDSETIKQLQMGWPLMLAILGTPTALLRAYFAMRTKEKTARYDMTASMPPKSLVNDIVGMFKKE
jgi:hypothetical protein